ncbi:MAG TPA: T9SS type A sorting domain-containing protein, partial [Prolixibacteraceae bacterium]
GGPLFDQNKQLIGTLTGGSATCALPTNDYFEKFALSWAYRNETSKQLKAWLDPTNSNVEKINGMYQVPDVEVCKPVTNFTNNETHSAIQIINGTTKRGYYSGTNVVGYTDFAEQFKFSKSCVVQGISLGIARVKTNPSFAQSFINVQVFEGTDKPNATALYSQKFDIKKLSADGMNYLPFQTPVKTTGNFFITYNIQELHSGDTLAVYMANRIGDTTNSFFLKNNTGWVSYNSQNTAGNGSALLTELIACSIDLPTKIDTFDNGLEATFFPNPLNGSTYLTIRTKNKIDFPTNTVVYDLLGKEQNISFTLNAPNELMLNFSHEMPGIYFVHVEAGGKSIVGKIAYIP